MARLAATATTAVAGVGWVSSAVGLCSGFAADKRAKEEEGRKRLWG